jgi:hypothetical protein
MKKIIGIGLATALAAVAAPASAATFATCTVVSSGPLTSTLGGAGYSIANAIGSVSGAITCPALAAATGIAYTNYKVFAVTDYQNASINSPLNSVTQILTLVGGALSGATQTAISTGGISSSVNSPANPFQIGSTLAGPAASYGSFTVDVSSAVTTGGPISNSGGQIYLSYDVVPEPATWALMLAGFGLTGAAMRQKKMALSYS